MGGPPRLLRLGHLERLPHRLRHNLRADELRVPLHRRSEERDQVAVLNSALERVYAALLRLELNGGHLQFEIESNALNSRDFLEGLG